MDRRAVPVARHVVARSRGALPNANFYGHGRSGRRSNGICLDR